jgi:hypothetical protein
MANAEDPPKPTKRVTLTAKDIAGGAGRALGELANNVLADGKLTEAEVKEIRAFLDAVPDAAIPAIAFIKEELSRFLSDGIIYPWELGRLQLALERVLPAADRTIAREARKRAEAELEAREASEPPEVVGARDAKWNQVRAIRREDLKAQQAPTEAQLKYIAHMGGVLSAKATKAEASELIDKLLAEQDPIEPPTRLGSKNAAAQSALEKAVANHESRSNAKTRVSVQIPPRQPYEGKATLKQKDLLWQMGFKDQDVLDSLGKWQASSLIDQLKAAKKGGCSSGLILLIIVIVVIVFVAFSADQ